MWFGVSELRVFKNILSDNGGATNFYIGFILFDAQTLSLPCCRSDKPQMATEKYDLTPLMTPFFDVHLVGPLLDHLSEVY